MTRILFNGNRIIVDGHADTAEECRAITAMCDSMANNENFKTIVYEEGHAVFEQVSGGESELFSMLQDYVLASQYDQEVGAEYDIHKGTIKRRLDDLEANMWRSDEGYVPKLEGRVEALAERIAALEAILPATAEVGQYLKVSAVDKNGKITAVEPVSVPAEYQLPYTASELVEKLSAL